MTMVMSGKWETRLRKLHDGKFDAIVLAEAGLKRLGLAVGTSHVIPRNEMLPAVGQGALAIETRVDDKQTRSLLSPLDNLESHWAVLAERTLLAELRAGCLAPVGAWGRVEKGQLLLDSVVLSPDGKKRLSASGSDRVADAAALGRNVAANLLEQGAAELIAASRAN